jgi:hypothetical protein
MLVSSPISAQYWALRPLLDWSAAGLGPWSRTSPVVLDRAAGPRPIRCNGKCGSAESPTPRRSAAPERRPAAVDGGAERSTFRAHCHPLDCLVRLARDAGAATASPGGRRRPDACDGKLRTCAPARTRVRRLGTGQAPGCCAAGRRPGPQPARPIKAAGRHMARQPGSEGLKARSCTGSCLRCRPAGWCRAGL